MPFTKKRGANSNGGAAPFNGQRVVTTHPHGE